jgi:hypothetical protein
VAGRLRGDAEAAASGVAHGLGYVIGARDSYERGRTLVVGEVEGLTRGVPGLVALGEDLALETRLEFGEASGLRDEHAVSMRPGGPPGIEAAPNPDP